VSTDISKARNVSVETYRRNGMPVRTPVWLVSEGATVFVRTDPHSGKVKRIKNNPHVRLAPSDMRGNVKGPWVDGEARFVEGAEAKRVLELFQEKYGMLFTWVGIWRRLRGGGQFAVIAIKPEAAPK